MSRWPHLSVMPGRKNAAPCIAPHSNGTQLDALVPCYCTTNTNTGRGRRHSRDIHPTRSYRPPVWIDEAGPASQVGIEARATGRYTAPNKRRAHQHVASVLPPHDACDSRARPSPASGLSSARPPGPSTAGPPLRLLACLMRCFDACLVACKLRRHLRDVLLLLDAAPVVGRPSS